MIRRQEHDQVLDAQKFGRRLLMAREAKKLSKTDVGNQLRISPNSIYYYEIGKSTPSLDTFLALMNLYGMSADDALDRVEYGALKMDNLMDVASLFLFLRDKLGAEVQTSGSSNTVSVTFNYDSADLWQYFKMLEMFGDNEDLAQQKVFESMRDNACSILTKIPFSRDSAK